MSPGPLAEFAALALTLALPLIFGLPLAWLLRGRGPLDREGWLLAPYLGLGALVLVLQNLVYSDVPVARATPFVWLAAAGLWAFFLRAGGWRAARAALPARALLVALAVFALQGAALLATGPQRWVGRLWDDQYGYTSMAQFFRDERYSLTVGEIGQRAYLFRTLRPSMGRFAVPVTLKENRIGQSMLQAFLAASLGRDAKPLFGPLAVLGAPLLALTLVLLAGRLGLPPPLALLAGALGGLLPALTALQVESFLSHALVLGCFPAWLVALDDLGRRSNPGRLAAATLLLSFGFSDYCEMWAAFLALGLLVLGARGLLERRLLPALRDWGLVVLLTLLAHLRFVPRFFFFQQIAATEGTHRAIYPWAYQLEGLARLWLGDLAPLGGPLAAGAGLALTTLGALGLALWSTTERGRLPLALGALALGLGALPLRLTGQHPYQFYKTLLTGAPVLALGLVALAARPRATGLRRACLGLAGLTLLAATAATLHLVWPTARPLPAPRSNQAQLLAPEVQELQERLESLAGHELVLGPGMPPLLNSWLTYYSRGNEVWLATPFMSRDRLRESREAEPLLDLTRAPAQALVLARTSLPAPPPGARALWSNSAYALWQPRAGPWLTLFDAQQPLELGPLGARLWLLSGARGRARLSLSLPGDKGSLTVRWAARPAPQGGSAELAPGATLELELEVAAGYNEVVLERLAGEARNLTPVAARLLQP